MESGERFAEFVFVIATQRMLDAVYWIRIGSAHPVAGFAIVRFAVSEWASVPLE